jgi:hypothetical protein
MKIAIFLGLIVIKEKNNIFFFVLFIIISLKINKFFINIINLYCSYSFLFVIYLIFFLIT